MRKTRGCFAASWWLEDGALSHLGSKEGAGFLQGALTRMRAWSSRLLEVIGENGGVIFVLPRFQLDQHKKPSWYSGNLGWYGSGACPSEKGTFPGLGRSSDDTHQGRLLINGFSIYLSHLICEDVMVLLRDRAICLGSNIGQKIAILAQHQLNFSNRFTYWSCRLDPGYNTKVQALVSFATEKLASLRNLPAPSPTVEGGVLFVINSHFAFSCAARL